MSSLTTINAGDNIADSRSVINTNFSTLNTDKEEVSNKSTDTTLAANSDTLYPSQKAVKAYVDSAGSITTGLTQSFTAGNDIDGSQVPVPVYQNKTDNKVYACDGNDTSKLKFMGFADPGASGATVDVITTGLVGGFVGLSEGEKYYLSDTAGTISATPGTYEVLVGIAISETQLIIQKGRRFRNGSLTLSDGGADETTTNTAITLGFRPSIIRARAVVTNGAASFAIASGTWVNGVYANIYNAMDASAATISGDTNYILHAFNSGNNEMWQVTITSVTDLGFTFAALQKIDAVSTMYIEWEAEGEQ